MKKFILFITLILFSLTSCEQIVEGCTQSSAINFNPSATNDDGSCVFSITKRWYVANYNLNNQELSSPGDFIEFFNDGSYSMEITNFGVEIGTWSTDNENATITLNSLELNSELIDFTNTLNLSMSNSDCYDQISSLIISGTVNGYYLNIIMYSTN